MMSENFKSWLAETKKKYEDNNLIMELLEELEAEILSELNG